MPVLTSLDHLDAKPHTRTVGRADFRQTLANTSESSGQDLAQKSTLAERDREQSRDLAAPRRFSNQPRIGEALRIRRITNSENNRAKMLARFAFWAVPHWKDSISGEIPDNRPRTGFCPGCRQDHHRAPCQRHPRKAPQRPASARHAHAPRSDHR